MSETSAPRDPATTRLRTMLSPRVANMLGREGIDTLADLMDYTRSDLEGLRSFGTLTMAEIDDALAARGLCLAGRDPERGSTLAEEFRMVLDQRNQLLALIERITDAVGTSEVLRDITTTLDGMDLTPTMRQTAATHHRTVR
ncbi:DNA-directed RNA polymerase subunit alpha C-terminal domain-containing protein [Nocardia sp. NPDC057440]|uniref:DNA-directed RNA polymerase subunit alpha C-terminal domain-containing protein n=1 Tax=Nocardia sp. NPDC057440 TaxID=3346134 RepID=UPI00366D855A